MLSKKRPSKPPQGARPRRAWPFGRGRRAAAPLDLGDHEGLPEGFAAANDAPEHETLGDQLRAARHDRGLTLDELADTTRVRRAYLEAIEEMRLEELPSRPFTIGYIRAYAQALDLDGDAAVERFKAEEPVLDEPLRNPIGVPDEKDPRVAAFVVGAIAIIAAIVLWNIAQRAMNAAAPAPPKAPDELAWKLLQQAKPAPVELGTPLPAPVESTTPPPYETPGLAEALGKASPGQAAAAPKAAEDPIAAQASLPQTFVPTGQVYAPSNPALNSSIVIQAVKPGLLIARGADGSVYFARQLAKGDAYRVPQVAGLQIEVSNPQDFQAFVSGQSRGLLPAAQVLASKLVTPAPNAPATAAPSAAPKPAAAAPAAPAPK